MNTRAKKDCLGRKPRLKIKDEIDHRNHEVFSSWFLEAINRLQRNDEIKQISSYDSTSNENETLLPTHVLVGSASYQIVLGNSGEVTCPADDRASLDEQWELIRTIQRHLVRMSAKHRLENMELMEVLYNLMISVKLITP